MKLTPLLSVGVEPEGHIAANNIIDGDFHYDSSVEVDGRGDNDCDGACRDDCDCASDCGCEECLQCELCECHPESCDCIECYTCTNCNEHYESCECDKANSIADECKACLKIIEAGDNLHCDECFEAFADSNYTQSCDTRGHSYIQCDMDCGCDCQCECDCNSGEGQDGEAVSNPMPETEMQAWLEKNEPAILRTNGTCGMHIHVGGMSIQEYGVLMNRDFHEFLKIRLIEWGKEEGIREGSSFWRRLEGNNSFCKDEFRPEEQKLDRSKGSQRYCFVNYCWKLHKTMEVRVLPCFQRPELRVKGFKAVMSIIHDYLENNKPKIHSLEIKEVI